VHEAEAVALQLLHDEALAAEQAHADLPLEGDADRHAAAAQRNESFWQISWPPIAFRSMGRILPAYGAANATRCLPRALVR
jgi:hypothetical protein